MTYLVLTHEERLRRFRKSLNCKLWGKCKNKDCLVEAMQLGVCIWSVEVCYALNDLKNEGLVITK